MSEMVERIMRALYAEDQKDIPDPEPFESAMLNTQAIVIYDGLARAALQAMRDINDRMLEAGGSAFEVCLADNFGPVFRSDAATVWDFMLTAALEDPRHG